MKKIIHGKIQGTIENQKEIGTISKNTSFGIYGKLDDLSSINIDLSKQMEVATRAEIKTGKATILCSLDNQKPKEYEIEIEEIYKNQGIKTIYVENEGNHFKDAPLRLAKGIKWILE